MDHFAPSHHHPSVFLRATRRCKHWIKTRAAEASLTDWLMAFLTLAIVYLAWSGGRQTDDLITAATKNAEAAGKFSQSAESINAAVGGAVQDFKRMTSANETSADAARASSDTARAALEISERAYVGITSVVMDKDLADGQESKITVTIANGGRTPAFSMRTRHYYAWGPKAIPNPRTYTPIDVVSTDILIPNVELIQASDKVANLHEPAITLIRDGRFVLDAYGITEYTDVFKKKRTTKYCFRYDPANPTAFIVCPEGNEAN
jgi:hypothetical protein